MAKRYGCYAEDMIQAAKETLIHEIRVALTDYDPTTDNAQGVIAAIGGMIIMTDKFCMELEKEKADDK